MAGQDNQIGFWTLCLKAIVLLFVISSTYLAASAVLPVDMLVILVYMCVNLTISITRHHALKQWFNLVSILLLLGAAYYVHPQFILLLPVNVYELLAYYLSRRLLVFILLFLPVVFVPDGMVILYGFVALVTFFILTIIRTLTDKIAGYRIDIATMREHNQQLSLSLSENKEYIRQSEYTVKLEERNRMSQEIHDKIGHSMTGALIQMEASKRLMNLNRDKSAELLDNAIAISKEGIESIRLVLKNVKPPMEQLGVNRMKLLLDEFSSAHAIKTTLTYKGNIDIITPMQWKVIQENANEALTNMLKYSGATAVSVDIRVLHTVIKAIVADNGKGALKVVKGLGLLGMEERTASVNGKIIADGSHGFSVTMLIPY